MLILRVLLSLLLLGILFPANASRESDYLTRDYGRFAVTFCPEDSSLADPLVKALSQRLPGIVSRLQLPPPDSAHFVITPSAEEWGRVTAGSPLWANGVAYPSRSVAVLKSPRFNGNGGSLEDTGVHELVHLLLEAGAENSAIPRWVDEGLAQFMSGQQEFRDVHVLSRASASGRLLTLSDIQGLMSMNAGAALQGYAQSVAAIEDLWRRFGDAGLANLVHELRSGKDIDTAFPMLFGMSLGQFEREHREHLNSQYGGSLWTDTELWVSLLFVILVLAAGGFAYLRRKRTLAKWHTEYLPPPDIELRPVPYTVNYTVVRSRNDDEDSSEPPQDDDSHYDRPVPGN